MHALNNLRGGPYITQTDCRQACSQVVAALSEAAGGEAEDESQHLHPESGWLSIDVINVLGAAQLGIHVEANSTSLEAVMAQCQAAALVNWNNTHWTVLVSGASAGPWTHINSIDAGIRRFHGRMDTTDKAEIIELFADIQNHCGGYSLHRVIKASGTGHQFLETAGMRASLPPQDEVVPDMEESIAAASPAIAAPGAGVGAEISLVTINVDGVGEGHLRSPTQRITDIIAEVLRDPPDFLLLQEVTMPMYAELKRILDGWHVYKKYRQAEEYFNVTCVKPRLVATAADKCSSRALRDTTQGRHSLTVKRALWVVTNVHAESGGGAVNRDARAKQLLDLSRSHEGDDSSVHVLAGDLNLRQGEDQCLLNEGWRDVWISIDGMEEWTWRHTEHQDRYARFDRIYIRGAPLASVRCLQKRRLTNTWGAMTDHVAMRAVLRFLPRSRLLQDSCEPSRGAAESDGAWEERPSHYSCSKDLQKEAQAAPERKPDLHVTRIANAIEAEAARFRELVQLCSEDPKQRGDLEAQALTPWSDIPSACGFRVARPSRAGVCRHATAADRLEQQQVYTKCKIWASQCGVSDGEFQAALEGVPKHKKDRGIVGLPPCLKRYHCQEVWQHAKQVCVAIALRRAAADADRRLVGEELSPPSHDCFSGP